MISTELILFALSFLVLISIIFIKLSTNSGMPVLLLFVGIGILAGSEGIGGIYFNNVRLAQSIGVLALAFILYAGGLDTDWKFVKPVLWHSISLSTLGIIITAVTGGIFTAYLLNLPLIYGLLAGAIISSTDAAAVFSILKSKNINLKGNIKPVLELESGSNDPMAIFLTLGLLQLIQFPNQSSLSFIPLFILQMGMGTLIGFASGYTFIYLINKLNFDYQGIFPVFMLAFALFTYGLTALLGGSGFLAVYISGIISGNKEFVHKKGLIRFIDGLAWLSQIVMFVTLGLLVFPSHIIPVIVPGILISLFIIFIARPLSVFISLFPFKYSIKEKSFISLVGLRGAVPIILATFVLIGNLPHDSLIFNLVFFIVISSAVLQGWPLPLFAKLFKVNAPANKKIHLPLEFEANQDDNKDLVDIYIPVFSKAINKPIVELGLPQGNLIVLINREGGHIIPSGNTTLLGEDIILILSNKNDIEEIRKIFY